MTLQLITASRLRKFRACQRAHHLSYNERIRPVQQGEARRFGTLWHDGQDGYWRAQRDGAGNSLAAGIAAMRGGLQRSDGELDEWDLIKAEELLAGYDLRWESSDIEVLEVEVEFNAPLVNPETGSASRTYRLGGKIDAIVRETSSGDVYVVERKTSTEDISPGSAYWSRLRIDAQISTYQDGAVSLGYPVVGALYDVVVRLRHRPHLATPEPDRKYTTKPSRLKDGTIRPAGSLHANQRERDETAEEFRMRVRDAIANAPDRFYARGTVVRLDTEMEDHRYDVWFTAKHMREVERTGRHVRNPASCMLWGRPCSYWPICTGEASADDESRYRRDGTSHPELTDAAQG
jgi:hypothetical protein